MTLTPGAIAEQLGQTGLCICPDFLDKSFLKELRADFDAVQAAGGFTQAGTGQGKGHGVRALVRSDEVHWFNRFDANFTQSSLWSRLDILKSALNRELFLGLTDFEGHYASYPPGGFYQRHLDCFREDDARVVSLILYLNQDWKDADGGQLVFYREDGSQVSILPEGGTLVCFMSRESEHEVVPGLRTRSSFAGWYKRSKTQFSSR